MVVHFSYGAARWRDALQAWLALGVPEVPLQEGLGVGGVAVALGAQETLKPGGRLDRGFGDYSLNLVR